MTERQLIYVSLAIAVLAIALAAYLYLTLLRLQKTLRSAFAEESDARPFEIQYYLDNLLKQKSILNLDAAGKDLASNYELTEILTKIAKKAKKLFDCEFVELSLIDTESEIYHSACSVGQPVKYYSGTESHKQEIKPVNFAGKRFGILRLVFAEDHEISREEEELLNLLAMQAAIAILNSRYSDELLRLKEQSEESVKAKTGFLANLSHELRGPLGIMLNAVEIVLSGVCGEIEPMQEKTLSMVKKNGDHLLDLIHDVLDYAKVEAGKVIPDPKAISVKELVADIGKLVNSQALQKKHKLYYDDEANDFVAICDRRHIRQILINLLTNAIKYTESGGKIDLWAERAAGNRIKILVKDNGVGIAEDQKDLVFSAFQRLDNKYSKKQVGTGLGLSLTVKLAEANDGKVGFDSEDGKGSTFWVTLPAGTEADLEDSVEVRRPDPKTASGEQLLVFESNSEEASVLQHYLSNLNYHVTLSHNNKIEDLERNDYSAMLIDNNVFEDLDDNFLEDIKQHLGREDLPVILMTSRAFDFDTENYLKMGVDICLNKPFKLSELALKIEESLRR